MLAAAPVFVLGSCQSDDTDLDAGQPSTVETTTGVPSTSASTTTGANNTVVTLSADDRPRTPPADATGEFAGVPPAASFDALAAEVVASIERQHPEDGSRLETESASAGSATTGTVAVRWHGFSDDSLAGFEYLVSVEESGGVWTVVSATRSAICYRGVTGGLCV